MKQQGHSPLPDESSQNSQRRGRSISKLNVSRPQNASADGATALPDRVRVNLERAFQSDFSQARIHANDSGADSINALVATQGKDVQFAPGQYDPASQEGQRVIGHEMAHVVQQMQGRVASPTGGMNPINLDQRLEAGADEWGAGRTAKQRINPIGWWRSPNSEASDSRPGARASGSWLNRTKDGERS